MGRIVVSVTSFNNDEEVLNFGKQLSVQSYADDIIYLVTTNSAKNLNSLKNCLNKLKVTSYLYNPEKNLGYLNGCLYGIKQYNSVNGNDIFVISNTDLTFLGDQVFSMIAEYMKDRRIWCLGPSIQDSTGNYQNPFLTERPSAKKIQMWKFVQGNSILLKIYTDLSRVKKNIHKKNVKAETQDVYALHGSFLVLSYACMRELLNFRNEIFMYGEEILTAELVRTNGRIVRYVSDIEIIHNENSTTRLTNSKNKAKWYKQSFNHIYLTFFRE